MLQNLELTDGLSELLTGLAVLNRGLVQHFHRANRFGANTKNTVVDTDFEQREPATDFADHSTGVDGHILERDFRGTATINRRVVTL